MSLRFAAQGLSQVLGQDVIERQMYFLGLTDVRGGEDIDLDQFLEFAAPAAYEADGDGSTFVGVLDGAQGVRRIARRENPDNYVTGLQEVDLSSPFLS